MDRKDFIRKGLVTGIAAAASPSLVKASRVIPKESTYDKMMEQVGFNHLPNNEQKTMNSVLHTAKSRGHANHGWLDSHHTFSFANYYNPQRMNFGVLRVLNDDRVDPGMGFSTHPHDNMEIISIPLEGDLEHKDSMGNIAVIREGDVQVMSAGTGIMHSEYNKNRDQHVSFLQIWVIPNKKGVQPRYDQISIKEVSRRNNFYQILSPSSKDQGVWIHQNAWFHLGEFDKGSMTSYEIKDPRNGAYFFVLDGKVQVNGQMLEKRDGYGLWNLDQVELSASEESRVLLMDVPMSLY